MQAGIGKPALRSTCDRLMRDDLEVRSEDRSMPNISTMDVSETSISPAFGVHGILFRRHPAKNLTRAHRDS